MLIGLVYDTHQDAMYIDLHVVIYLGTGDVVCETIICVILYMAFEWPVKKLIDTLRGV